MKKSELRQIIQEEIDQTIFQLYDDNEKKLSPKQLNYEKKLQDKFMGKKAEIYGVGGIVKFVGYNRYLDNVPQVTLNRTPVYPIEFNDLQLVNDDTIKIIQK